MTKIAILTNGDRTWASSRLRGWWLQDANPVHFKCYGPGDPLDGLDACDAVVFQKRHATVDIERARRYQREGRLVIYDMTEPQWWFDPALVKEMISLADAVTTSSPALTEAVQVYDESKTVITLPDRILPSFHPTTASHGPRERVRLVWFGATQNRIALAGALPLLGYLSHYYPIELRIIDGDPRIKLDSIADPERTKVVHIPFALETFHANLIDCDLAILPPYPGPWGQLKSNNKQVTAWWAGLPVVSGFDLEELQRFLADDEARAESGARNRQLAEREFAIGKSVAQWLELVADLRDGRAIERDLRAHPELLVESAPTAGGD